MSKKSKLSIIAIVIVVLIILIAVLWSQKNKKTPTPSNINAPTVLAPETGLQPLVAPVTIEPPPTEPQPQKPEVIAALFAERYGSYSNQSSYQNVRDLFPQMTARERTEIENFIKTTPFEATVYSGTTTKVVRTEMGARTGDRISFTVFTQRIDATANNPQSRIYYQTAQIELVKSGLTWLVDRFVWK